ncbi:hypothetical protein [Butyrivibrio sp. AE3003]|uniref:hypothetical protein n=1 Tax=Butyrivibrio sp. AE3003 TaxID=1496721 RepID=UPI00047B3272|nr:hypothetical protein [Butyrivibrio sp. AE3003]
MNAFNSGDATMMFIVFDDGTSADTTLEAVENIRKISNEQCFMSGMSAIVADLKSITISETPIYVVNGGCTCCDSSLNHNGFLSYSCVFPSEHRNGG